MCKTEHFRTQKQSTNSNQEGRISEQGIMNPTKNAEKYYFLCIFCLIIFFRGLPTRFYPAKITFGRPQKPPHIAGTFSGIPESLPTPPAQFRAFPKISRHHRHVFGHPRKSADIAGTVSGHPEEQKTKNGAFASFRFLLFHLFHLFTFSPLSRGGTSQQIV